MRMMMHEFKGWLNKLFSPASEVSSMRVMCFISLLTGCYIGIRGLEQGKNLSELAILCGTFLTAAFTGKVVQKGQENKEPKTSINKTN
jgi:hypothetical protein